MLFWILIGVALASFVFIMFGHKNEGAIGRARAWLTSKLGDLWSWIRRTVFRQKD